MSAKVIGMNQLLGAMARERRKHDSAAVNVGYEANYALPVHENLAVPHQTGQAKFLEQPLREMEPSMLGTFRALKARGLTTLQALLIMGLSLQRASQLLVPVDTGNLKASAFTRKA